MEWVYDEIESNCGDRYYGSSIEDMTGRLRVLTNISGHYSPDLGSLTFVRDTDENLFLYCSSLQERCYFVKNKADMKRESEKIFPKSVERKMRGDEITAFDNMFRSALDTHRHRDLLLAIYNGEMDPLAYYAFLKQECPDIERFNLSEADRMSAHADSLAVALQGHPAWLAALAESVHKTN